MITERQSPSEWGSQSPQLVLDGPINDRRQELCPYGHPAALRLFLNSWASRKKGLDRLRRPGGSLSQPMSPLRDRAAGRPIAGPEEEALGGILRETGGGAMVSASFSGSSSASWVWVESIVPEFLVRFRREKAARTLSSTARSQLRQFSKLGIRGDHAEAQRGPLPGDGETEMLIHATIRRQDLARDGIPCVRQLERAAENLSLPLWSKMLLNLLRQSSMAASSSSCALKSDLVGLSSSGKKEIDGRQLYGTIWVKTRWGGSGRVRSRIDQKQVERRMEKESIPGL